MVLDLIWCTDFDEHGCSSSATNLEEQDVIQMAALLILIAVAVVAIVATIVTVLRDGYCQVAFRATDARDAWPSTTQPSPTRLM
jgi:hypothetical protein